MKKQDLKKIIKEEIKSFMKEGSMMDNYIFDVKGTIKISSAYAVNNVEEAKEIALEQLNGILDNIEINPIQETTISESQKTQIKQEMSSLLKEAKKRTEETKQLMRKKGYNV